MARETAYDGEQFEHNYPDGMQDHYWIKARHDIVWRYLKGIVPEGAAVLDVGCGRGMTVEFLRGQGIEAFGCDLGSPRPISDAVAPHLRLGANAFSLEESFRRSISVILALDVLEHLEDPAAFLRELHAQYPSCRYVLATLPARQEVWSNYDERYGHFLRYDAASVRTMCRDASGFALERTSYFFHLLYPPALALAVLHAPRQTVVSSPTASARWGHRLLAAYFRAEEKILPRWLPGTSMLAMFRRT